MKNINWALVLVIMQLLLIVGVIAFEIYVWVRFGSLPVTEIPAWALFFMFGRGGSK